MDEFPAVTNQPTLRRVQLLVCTVPCSPGAEGGPKRPTACGGVAIGAAAPRTPGAHSPTVRDGRRGAAHARTPVAIQAVVACSHSDDRVGPVSAGGLSVLARTQCIGPHAQGPRVLRGRVEATAAAPQCRPRAGSRAQGPTAVAAPAATLRHATVAQDPGADRACAVSGGGRAREICVYEQPGARRASQVEREGQSRVQAGSVRAGRVDLYVGASALRA